MTVQAATTTTSRPTVGLGLTVAAAGVGIVGLLLPWASASIEMAGMSESESTNGFGEDFFGLPVLIALVLGTLAAFAALRSRFVAVISVICGLAVVLLAFAGFAKVNNTQAAAESILGPDGGAAVTAGSGLWCTLAGGVLMTVAAVIVILRARRTQS